MHRAPLLAIFGIVGICGQSVAQETRATSASRTAAGAIDARSILVRYAQAWRGPEEMPLKDTIVVNFVISGPGGGDYHVVLAPGGTATVLPDTATRFDFGFATDIQFLRRLDRGEMNAQTALAQARGSDDTPMRARFPAGIEYTPQFRKQFMGFVFHFFTRDWPEVVPFGEPYSRRVHGGNASLLYYDTGLRSSWYQLKPGMHINADPDSRSNPFASLVICIRGRIKARLGGFEQTIRAGQAVLVPAGMSHEFWAGPHDHGEFILLMTGEGA